MQLFILLFRFAGEFEEMRNTIEQVARDRLKKIGRGNDTEFKRGMFSFHILNDHEKFYSQVTISCHFKLNLFNSSAVAKRTLNFVF